MGLFEKGVSGNPVGRPKGLLTGRARALYALDQVVSRDENVALIEETLEKTLREKPMWFFVNIIMPLLPKETKGVVEAGDRAIEWTSLLTVFGDGREAKNEAGGQRAEVGVENLTR